MSLTLQDGVKQNLPRRLINAYWIRSRVSQTEGEEANGEERRTKWGFFHGQSLTVYHFCTSDVSKLIWLGDRGGSVDS